MTSNVITIPCPRTGKGLFQVCDTSPDELDRYITEFKKTPIYGLHNPKFNVDRYIKYGEISKKLAHLFEVNEVKNKLHMLISRCVSKSDSQIDAEIRVTRKFLENFSGDQVRFLAKGQTTSGDHTGQESVDYRYPYGKVTIISPFNFPLEIPLLQLMGALYMGNRPMLHVDMRVSPVMSYVIQLLLDSEMPPNDMMFINGRGQVINQFLIRTQPEMTMFTGSSKVAESLSKDLNGKIKIEGGGFNWKIINDIRFRDQDKYNEMIDEILRQCDIDAYEFGGQKCSAQSILFINNEIVRNYRGSLTLYMEDLAKARHQTNVSLLSINNKTISNHIEKLLEIPESRLVFGGPSSPDSVTKIPIQYGSFSPTLIYIPLERLIQEHHYDLVTTEIFGPVQIVTYYDEIDTVITFINKISHKLTAGIVSDDSSFLDYVLGRTVNGVTYSGTKARTTGAPQNHWFGPGHDPRAGSLGTPEAIRYVWSYNRTIINDNKPYMGKVGSSSPLF